MAQAVRKRASPPIALNGHIVRHLKEAGLLALCAVACFVFVAFLTYHPADPAWTHTGTHAGRAISNKAGVAGAWLADIALHLFGYVAYLFPAALAFSAWLLFKGLQSEDGPDYLYGVTRLVGFLLTVLLGSGLVWAHLDWGDALPYRGAGIIGGLIGREVEAAFGHLGGTMLMLAMFLTGVTLFTGLSWFRVMDITGRWVLRGIDVVGDALASITDRLHGRRARRERAQVFEVETSKIAERPKPRIEAPPLRVERPVSFGREQQVSLFDPPDAVQPPLSLLDLPPPPRAGFSTTTLEAMSRQVELKLQDFGIEVAVVAVHPGPVITRFELQPAPGVKASRITSLNRDLARSLSTISVRVVEVIPGKSVIGLEIPNHHHELVALRDILGAPEYEGNPSAVTLALGKDIGGKPVAVDLARMPHLLVAGTTGAGKSVALNAMILSMLYKASLREVRLIMIDPKMLELSVYDGIPSLLAPVVTDMKEAANALRWCVAEMERRYKLMAALGVRNLAGYNRKIRDAETAGEPLRDPFGTPAPVAEAGWAGEVEVALLCTLPYIVVIVDELADMMMTVGKKVEELIARLAQKARASGIHLILATQRPSVDVITGLIKANIPSRIAFQVSSRVDSRTILDQMGAENLLGHGDMLYLPPGTGVPVRVHGAFVSDQEVHKVVAYLKSRGTPEYVEAIVSGEDETGAEDPVAELESGGEADALYDEAVRFVAETRRASVSGVQRRLKIGYNRAARMVEEMERQGVVGSLQSTGFREVLVRPPPAD
ncbi:MAG: DNA translocase FtsK [Gammaproteobacteria bacterium]